MEIGLIDYLDNFKLGIDNIYSEINKDNNFEIDDSLSSLLRTLQRTIFENLQNNPNFFGDRVDIGLFNKEILSTDNLPQFNIKSRNIFKQMIYHLTLDSI